MKKFGLVTCACAGAEEAERIAHALVEERLAACVQILPGVRSIYRWQGKVESAEEILLLIKTSEEKFDRLQARVTGLHSYEVPEIVALRITAASSQYLGWLETELDD